MRPIDGVLKCPTCRQTGDIARHDIFPMPPAQTNFQDFLQHCEGHECTICHEVHHLHNTALGTFQPYDGSQACRHVFCYTGLLQVRCIDRALRCPTCRQTGYIVRHGIVERSAQQRRRHEQPRVMEDSVSVNSNAGSGVRMQMPPRWAHAP